MNYEYLLEFCNTERQKEYISAIISEGSGNLAAKKLGIDPSALHKSVRKIKARAAKALPSEHDITMGERLAEGFSIDAVSNMMTNQYGKPIWIKYSKDDLNKLNAFNDYIDALKEDIPTLKPVNPPRHSNPDLLVQYILTDYHMGMMAWHEETGSDWDMKIAENMLLDWMRYAISTSPDADEAVFANLGDFLHWDGMDAVTPAHRHLLDADTRFSKLCRIASRCIVQCIRMLLTKHKKVHVKCMDANHDPASQAWFRAWLPIVFENEPRVTIDTSPSTYGAYQFGSVGLFYHHGHKRKPKDIDKIFVRKYRDIYGSTKHCYAHMGHLHSDATIESQLMKVRQYRTLASADAYAAQGGWLSGREAVVTTYHKEYGDIGSNVITPEMLGY